MSREAILVVLTPDCLASSLSSRVVQWIRNRTALSPSAQCVRRFTRTMVEELYADSTAPERPEWPLIVRLYESGESICLIYEPGDRWRDLVTLKGATHPADAAEGTIRRSFWCDNGICNLVHMSDNPAVTAAQLRIARFDVLASPDNFDFQQERINHSGIVMLLRVLQRFRDRDAPSGDEPRMFHDVRNALPELITSRDAAQLVSAYFDGQWKALPEILPPFGTSAWETFILQCGAASVRRWMKEVERLG